MVDQLRVLLSLQPFQTLAVCLVSAVHRHHHPTPNIHTHTLSQLTHTWISVDNSFALNELGRGEADLHQPGPEVHVSIFESLEHEEEELGHLLALALYQVQNLAHLVVAQA